MKSYHLGKIIIALLLILCGEVHADLICSAFSPEASSGIIPEASDFTIEIWIDNTTPGEDLLGGSFTFYLYSPDASISTISHRNVGGLLSTQSLEYINNFESYFNFLIMELEDGWNGSLPDTVGVSFSGVFGLPPGNPNQGYLRFSFSAVDNGTLCIDSTPYPPNPTWDWLFSAQFYPVTFNGPYCWTIGEVQTNEIAVTNLDDAGVGSLRWAIDSANTSTNADSIVFSVSGTIFLADALPTLSNDTTKIIGSTAPGGIHSMIIDGSGMAGETAAFLINASYCEIEGLVIKNSTGNAITITGMASEGNRISKNLIYDNDGLAIDLGGGGVTDNDPSDSDEGPNHLLNYPVIDSAVYNPLDSGYSVYFDFSESGVVEFFAAHTANDPSRPEDPSGHGEAYEYLGSMDVSTKAKQVFSCPKNAPIFTSITATMTSDQGTSKMSYNYTLFTAPLIIVAYSPVNLKIIDPVGDSVGKDASGVFFNSIGDATYDESPNDSVTIFYPLEGTYIIIVVTEDGAPPGSTYGIGIRIDGSTQCILIENANAPVAGEADTLDYLVEEGYHYENGDATGDKIYNLLDILLIIDCLYGTGEVSCPDPYLSGDANCDRLLNLIDILYLIDYIYGVPPGPPPCPLGE